MAVRAYTLTILIAFCLTAVFGLYFPMMSQGGGHEVGCPFLPGGTALCGTPLAHAEHWQAAFTAVLVEILILCAFVLVFFRRFDLYDPDVGLQPIRHSSNRVPVRPSLFQELFSAGILNRKAP